MTANDTIAAQVATMHADGPARSESELPSPLELDRARFVAEFDPAALVRVGSTLTDVELVDVYGRTTALFEALGDRTTVLVFYRGEWCPYCSIALRTYQRELAVSLDKFDAHLVAVSPQRPDGSLTAKEKNELSFTVLSDLGNKLARQFGIVITPSDASVGALQSYGLDLTERNADGTADLPMPSVAIVDAYRVLRFLDVRPDYATRTEPTEIVDTLGNSVSIAPFAGKAALVTGAGRGIGRAIALGVAERGASVVLASRTSSEIEAVRTEIEELGGVATAIQADVSVPTEIIRLLRETNGRFGPVAILVNNAAVVSPIGASRAIDAGAWAAAIDLNVTAVARLSFGVLPEMLRAGWGRIVNISSGIAAHPESMLRANAYATSKAALEAHTLNLAAELARTGVTVNAYRPGGVDTAMQAWIRDQSPEVIGQDLHGRFVASKDGGTLITPEESAAGLLPRLEGKATGQIWSVQDPM